MGVFRRSGHSGKTARAKTVIANGCQILGQITLDGDLHLDGKLDGTLQAVQVSVGKQGFLKGTLTAKHVTIAGRVEGHIYCELLELLDGCQVYGEVHCQNLVVEKGAKFIGTTRETMASLAAEVIVQETATLITHEPSTAVLVSPSESNHIKKEHKHD